MSERILKALMQLFSIVSDTESSNSRTVVEAFLKSQLNEDLVTVYLELYDQFIEEKTKTKDGEKKRKRTSVNSVKVLRICTQINEELAQRQKIVVLIRLIEFIYSNEAPSEQEFEFISTVAETFNINKEEYTLCTNFIGQSINEVDDVDTTLIINNKKEANYEHAKHIYSDGIGDGLLKVIRIKSVNMLFIRYFGKEEIFLNGQIFSPERAYILTQGSSIRSPKVQPIYYSDIISTFLSDTVTENIVFSVENLQYQFKGGNMGLYNFNFSEESGSLVGIMGASGAGKSTLLNLLNGTYMPTKGQVLINGVDIHREKDKIEGVIGYVSQDDLLIEELTVFQNLFYNAKLCFSSLDDKSIAKLVADTLTSLGLYEAKDLKVGSPLDKTISGGQRKRLNIALELIREPSVLFVDEPTSGLSSRDSENIMDLLKELALKGKLIFVVIHQPSSDIFKMFDRLLILDTGGYPIYNGNPVDAVVYFKEMVNHVNAKESECRTCGNVNPEQIFNIIESKVVDEYGNQTTNRKVSPKQWYKHYLEKIEQLYKAHIKTDEKPTTSFKIPSKLKQFKVFITRDVLSKLTNKQYLAINLLEAPVLAFILSYLIRYYNTDASNELGYFFRENENIPAYIFMSVIVALFIGLTVSAEEIIRDQKILKREKFLNLSKGSYLVSKISIMFILSAIQTFSFVLVGNLVLGIQGMFFEYWMVLFTTACFANMLGLNISASFNSAVTIYILIPFLIIPQLILSGVIVKFDKLNPTVTIQDKVPVVGEVMASRWAFEALAVNQFKNNAFEKQFYKIDKELKAAEFKKNFWLPKMNDNVSSYQNGKRDGMPEEELQQIMKLIKNEVEIELSRNKEVKFDKTEFLTHEKLTPEVLAELKSYLYALQKHYIKKYNAAYDKKDNLIVELNKDETSKKQFLDKKNNYTNDNLSDLVTAKTELNKILEIEDRLYQKADPIYLDADGVRGHFFAPTKKLFGSKMPTFWFNQLVIWVMSLILIITLYFNVLKRFIGGIEKLFEKIKR